MAISLTDDRGQRWHWEQPPQRIVSLVPSDTYTLIALGAARELVGRTRYCIAPAAEVEAIEIVGGAKDANLGRIIELRPDVVVANREDNSRQDVEALIQAGLKVYISFPNTVAAGLRHAAQLAALLPERQGQNTEILAAARRRLARAEQRTRPAVPTFVPIWFDPILTATGDTLLSDMLRLCGGRNVFADFDAAPTRGSSRYPRVRLDEIRQRAPELVLLPDEPFDFDDKHADFLRHIIDEASEHYRGVRMARCDGKDLLWYGLRCVEALDRLSALIAPSRIRSR